MFKIFEGRKELNDTYILMCLMTQEDDTKIFQAMTNYKFNLPLFNIFLNIFNQKAQHGGLIALIEMKSKQVYHYHPANLMMAVFEEDLEAIAKETKITAIKLSEMIYNKDLWICEKCKNLNQPVIKQSREVTGINMCKKCFIKHMQ